MRVTGVRLAAGRVVWVDAGEVDLQPLDVVAVKIDGEEVQGQVMVAPGDLLRLVSSGGRLLRLHDRESGEGDCSNLPGADMPPLGTHVESGVVIAVDAVNRSMTVQTPDGTRITRAWPHGP